MLFAVPAVMEIAGWSEKSAAMQLRRTFVAFVALQAALVLLHLMTSTLGPKRWRSQQWDAFDAHAFADHIATPARAALGGPIRVVAGTSALAGALSIELSERPMVLIDGNYAFSPWVSPDLVSRCGVLIVGEKAVLPAGTPVGANFPMLAWAIVPPHEGAKPCR